MTSLHEILKYKDDEILFHMCTERDKYYKRYCEYKEVDRNKLADKYFNIYWIYSKAIALIEDGYKYRYLKYRGEIHEKD